MESYQDITFSTRIQDGIPKDNQSNKNENVWQAEKTLTFFIEFWEVISKPGFFWQGSKIGSQGIIEGTKRRMSVEWKKPNDFLLNFRGSYQSFIFSTKTHDEDPKDNPMYKKQNDWHVHKP